MLIKSIKLLNLPLSARAGGYIAGYQTSYSYNSFSCNDLIEQPKPKNKNTKGHI